MAFEKKSCLIAEKIEGNAQWPAPLLVPAGMAGVATAVGAPPFHAMDAAPRGVLDDLDFVGRRKFLQKLTIVRQFLRVLRFDPVESIRKGHFAVAMMMSIGLAVGGNVNKLGPVAGIGKAAFQAIGKLLAAIQQLLKSHGLGDWTIVEKNTDLASGGQLCHIGTGGIDASAADV